MKSDVIGRCDGDENNPNDHAEPTTSIAKSNNNNQIETLKLTWYKCKMTIMNIFIWPLYNTTLDTPGACAKLWLTEYFQSDMW